MFRINTLTKVLDLFGLGKHGFRDGNRALAIPATDLSAEWCNSIQEEIANVVEAAGIVLDANNRSQLLQAIQQMVISGQKAVIISNATFEASVSNGEVVRWDSGNNRFDEAIADGTANNRAVGVADVTNSKVYLYGECPNFIGLTPGARYYLDASTPGALTTSAPSNAIGVGIAKSATVLWVDVDAQAAAQLEKESPVVMNSAFWINQEAPASNADDTYAHDGWYALAQTGAIAVSTLSDLEDGTPRAARLTQSQVVAQRMGYAQIIEGRNCRHLRGKQVTFRFGRTRLSASANVRFAVLEWTGAEDVVTSDVVNDWTSGSYTAGGFFLGANLVVSGVAQQALVANTLTDGTDLTVTLGSTFNNLILLAWTEGTVAQNVTFDLAKAQIDLGAQSQQYRPRSYEAELRECLRHYWRNESTTQFFFFGAGFANTSAQAEFYVKFPVRMRVPPTATYSGLRVRITGSSVAITSLASNYASTDSTDISFNVAGGLTAGHGMALQTSGGAGDHLTFSARL